MSVESMQCNDSDTHYTLCQRVRRGMCLRWHEQKKKEEIATVTMNVNQRGI